MAQKTKILFMGSDPISLPLLEFLASKNNEHYELTAVISQPDRPSGRGKKITPNPISQWALDNNIPLLRPEKLDDDAFTWYQNQQPDITLVMAYGHILRKRFLELPPLGIYNFHASILPAYRGAAPIEAAIASGDSQTGVTLMEMVSKMDAGDIVDIEKVSIDSTDTRSSLRTKLSQACIPLLERLLKNSPDSFLDSISKTPQDESRVTYARKLQKDDAWIDFNLPAKEIVNRCRAFEGWPGTACKVGVEVEEPVTLKIGACSYIDETFDVEPGTITEITDTAVCVGTVDGTLCLEQLQRPGGKMLKAKDFLQGFILNAGMDLHGARSEPLVSKELV